MAQKSFTYLGWKRFTDTGHLYREWRLDEVVPELKAAENDTLCDHGPGDHWPTQERFDVRTEHKKHGRCFSLETVENALGLALPP